MEFDLRWPGSPKERPVRALIVDEANIVPHDLKTLGELEDVGSFELDGKKEKIKYGKEGELKYNVKLSNIFNERNFLGKVKQRYLIYDKDNQNPVGLAEESSGTISSEEADQWLHEPLTARGVAALLKTKLNINPKLLIFGVIIVIVILYTAFRFMG